MPTMPTMPLSLQVTALEPIFGRALQHLTPQGLLAFSVEQPQAQCESFRLEVSMGIMRLSVELAGI